MNLTPEQASLFAALIAALVSLFTVVRNISSGQSAEMRVIYRQSLEKYLPDLSESIHSVVATSTILIKKKVALEHWRQNANNAQNKLKQTRISVRYPLWGISEGINTLTRLPDWVEHARPFPKYAESIVNKGQKLGNELDKVIQNAFKYGRHPTKIECLRVWIAQKLLEYEYGKMQHDALLKR